MKADKPIFAGPLEARLYEMAEDHCARKDVGLRAFGAAATGDAEFFPDLTRKKRSPTLRTVDRILKELGQAPIGPYFEAEIDAFLAVTGTKVSVLGRGAANNPSFVAHIEDGMSPKLRTVGRVRAWMAAHASLAERREIRRRTGPMPDLLSDAPRRPRRSCRPSATALPARTAGAQGPDGWDDLPFIDTEEAAAFVGLAASTLARYRSTGNGPTFFRFPERIARYRHRHLVEWEAARRR